MLEIVISINDGEALHLRVWLLATRGTWFISRGSHCAPLVIWSCGPIAFPEDAEIWTTGQWIAVCERVAGVRIKMPTQCSGESGCPTVSFFCLTV